MKPANWQHTYVLHRRPYRETSYLVDLFTRESGKVSVVARGVRNSKGDKKSLLQPFQQIRIQYSGKSDLKNLTQTESYLAAIPLMGQALFCGMYANELLNRVMPAGLASEILFDSYTETLMALAGESDIELPLRQFEFAILDEMGLLGDFTVYGTQGDPVEPDGLYGWAQEEGIVPVRPGPSARGIPGFALLSLAAGEWTPAAKKAAKIINREALKPLLGNKPLKSRELFVPKKPVVKP